MTPHIASVNAREILDSRGNPTLEVIVVADDGHSGRTRIPSGASTGSHEAKELRDGDPHRYDGKGVRRAIENATGPLADAVRGLPVTNQAEIDARLAETDGSADKHVLGANAILGISLASAYAAAAVADLPLYRYLGGDAASLLPVPMFNVLNGGRHARGSTDFQEFMVAPTGARSFAHALEMGSTIYHALGRLLEARGLSTTVGDEGGFAPHLPSNAAAVELVLEAIVFAGFRPGDDVYLALDPAASEFYRDGVYDLAREGCQLSSAQHVELWADWCSRYPILSIEDGLAEDDWAGWTELTAKLGRRVQIVGDDIYVTNVDRIERGIQQQASTAVLIKPNQVGTLTETLAAIDHTRRAGWGTVISHRSGETDDVTIADLAVATNAGQIKAGAPARGERVAKYNRLLAIEEELGGAAHYAGIDAFVRRAPRPLP